jgi:hypothetical protein
MGRAVRPLTLRSPASLRTGRYFHVPAFADMRLTLPSPSHGESEARLRLASRPSAVAPASLRIPASLADRPKCPCLCVRHNVAHPWGNSDAHPEGHPIWSAPPTSRGSGVPLVSIQRRPLAPRYIPLPWFQKPHFSPHPSASNATRDTRRTVRPIYLRSP